MNTDIKITYPKASFDLDAEGFTVLQNLDRAGVGEVIISLAGTQIYIYTSEWANIYIKEVPK